MVNHWVEGIQTQGNTNTVRIRDLEARVRQSEQKVTAMEQYCAVVLHLFKDEQKSIQKLEAHIQYLQYRDITGCIRWLENVLFDNSMNTDGEWTRMYKKYNYVANWDKWVEDQV